MIKNASEYRKELEGIKITDMEIIKYIVKNAIYDMIFEVDIMKYTSPHIVPSLPLYPNRRVLKEIVIDEFNTDVITKILKGISEKFILVLGENFYVICVEEKYLLNPKDIKDDDFKQLVDGKLHEIIEGNISELIDRNIKRRIPYVDLIAAKECDIPNSLKESLLEKGFKVSRHSNESGTDTIRIKF